MGCTAYLTTTVDQEIVTMLISRMRYKLKLGVTGHDMYYYLHFYYYYDGFKRWIEFYININARGFKASCGGTRFTRRAAGVVNLNVVRYSLNNTMSDVWSCISLNGD